MPTILPCVMGKVSVRSRPVGMVRKSLLVRLRLIYNSFIIRISLSLWLTVRRKKRDRKVFAKHFPLILAGTMRTWVIRPRDKKIAKNAAKTALLATDRLNAVWRGVFGSSRRGAQPEEQRSAAPTRRLHQKFRLEHAHQPIPTLWPA